MQVIIFKSIEIPLIVSYTSFVFALASYHEGGSWRFVLMFVSALALIASCYEILIGFEGTTRLSIFGKVLLNVLLFCSVVVLVHSYLQGIILLILGLALTYLQARELNRDFAHVAKRREQNGNSV